MKLLTHGTQLKLDAMVERSKTQQRLCQISACLDYIGAVIERYSVSKTAKAVYELKTY
jgi:hypothetical protein